jgi:hypothetical protein
MKLLLLVLLAAFACLAAAVPAATGATQACVMCEQVMDILATGDVTTRLEIINALSVVCLFLPDSELFWCESFVQNNVDEIVEALEAGMTGDQVCRLLDVCWLPDAAPEPAPYGSDYFECALCDGLVGTIEQWLASDAIEGDIEQVAINFCDKEFADDRILRRECESIATEKIPQVVALLEADFPPERICEMLRLCDEN